MTLEQVIDAAFERVACSPDAPHRGHPDWREWIDWQWDKFLKERNISGEHKDGWVRVFPSCSLYLPPELAERMLVLGYLP